MKKTIKYLCVILLLVGSVQIDAAEDYSQMSTTELNAAFVTAVKRNRVEQMQELIQAGANVETLIPCTWTEGDCDWDIESTAFEFAVRHDYHNIVKVLLKEEKSLNKALNLAINQGYIDTVEELIEGGADIHYEDKYRNTPLMTAISHSRATAGFSLQAYSKARSRWLQRRQVIQALINAGANINHVNNSGRTPLMEAVAQHDLHTVQTLLKAPGININHADKDGNTALLLAARVVRYRYIDEQEHKICITSQKILQALMKTPGIDIFHANKNGETTIMLLEKIVNK